MIFLGFAVGYQISVTMYLYYTTSENAPRRYNGIDKQIICVPEIKNSKHKNAC